MSRLEEDLERWQAAGLLDSGTAARIASFERERRAARSPTREFAFEVLAYLGVALASVGVFALIAQSWEGLASWARILVVALPSLLGFALGFGLMRSSGEPLHRAARVAWVVASALVGGTVAVIANEAGASDRVVGLAGSGAALGAVLLVWALQPHPLTVLGLAGALGAFGFAAGAWRDVAGPGDEGLGVLAAGVLGFVLAELGLAVPERVARPAFAGLCLFGAFMAGLEGEVLWAETATVGLAVLLLAWSAVRRSVALTAVATIGLFVELVDIIFEYFEEELGAPVALILSGAVVLGAVLLLARFLAPGRRAPDAHEA
jgi:uncharacterized membrane protein